MQQKNPEVSDISENILKKLVENIPELINWRNFTTLPAWITQDLKDELILIFTKVRARLLQQEFNIKFDEVFQHTLTNGLNAQNHNEDKNLFIKLKKRIFIFLFEKANQFINEEIQAHKHLKLNIKQCHKRRICILGLGKFHINRTQFKTKTYVGVRTIILLDYFFNFRKRGILLKGEEVNILTKLTNTTSMQAIASECECSCQTISNYCKKLIYNIQERVITQEDCEVYVGADSTFTYTNRKNGRRMEVKTIVLWTNSKSISHSKLSDLSLVYVTKENSKNIYSLIKEKIAFRYPNHTTIKVVGDGAMWIKELGASFDGFYLDKFHYLNAIQTILSSFTGRHKKIFTSLSKISKQIIYQNADHQTPLKPAEMILKILTIYSQQNTNAPGIIIQINTGEIFKLQTQKDIDKILELITRNKLLHISWVFGTGE